MIRTATGLGAAARSAVILFASAAPLLLLGLLGVLGVFGDLSLLWLIVCIVALVIAVVLMAASLSVFVGVNRWARLRRGDWQRLAIAVRPDLASGEVAKTVLETEDEAYRILLLRYPLELRDQVQTDRAIEYVGTLGHDSDLLIRPVGGPLETETFGRAKSLARLQAERG